MEWSRKEAVSSAIFPGFRMEADELRLMTGNGLDDYTLVPLRKGDVEFKVGPQATTNLGGGTLDYVNSTSPWCIPTSG